MGLFQKRYYEWHLRFGGGVSQCVVLHPISKFSIACQITPPIKLKSSFDRGYLTSVVHTTKKNCIRYEKTSYFDGNPPLSSNLTLGGVTIGGVTLKFAQLRFPH